MRMHKRVIHTHHKNMEIVLDKTTIQSIETIKGLRSRLLYGVNRLAQ